MSPMSNSSWTPPPGDENNQTIGSISELITFANRYRDGKWAYRGVSNESYELTPKSYRIGVPENLERHMFASFCREISAHEGYRPDSEWDALAVAQHHGLPTRLLDWTENILVAAFFCCHSQPNRNGAIYAFSTLSFCNSGDGPFEYDRTAKFRPRHVTKRITAQRGLFTLHPPLESVLPVGDSPHKAYKVRKAIVPSTAKERLIWDLSRININERALFPDLDGLASFLTWAYSKEDPFAR